ncbi:MAG: hypothetical protein K6C05_08900 [Anaerovibrio sp.]|uniref:hypothetical protein n=1 Tax=Anaerovibrio sp. TaxID=1872532 RepID=UPI0025DC48DA|nr:hypothetical protein [Anaerovibrio sp.]MCR5176949.1 hypothetical protein [Anaerovibrio sp.]
MKQPLFLILGFLIFFSVWNLCDYSYTTFVDQEEFQFGLSHNLMLPAIVYIIISLFARKKDS